MVKVIMRDTARTSSSLTFGQLWQSLFAESSQGYQGLETLKQLMADLNLDRAISVVQGTACWRSLKSLLACADTFRAS